MVILVWRDPSDSGTDCHARKFEDPAEARRIAVHIAEVFGACEVHHLVDRGDLVLNSRAMRHDAPVRAPEVLVQALKDGV